jgi:hypothetical protein
VEAAPQRTGFGTLLARRSVEMQLGGEVEYDWATEGLRVRISLPLSRVAQVSASEPLAPAQIRSGDSAGLMAPA